MYRIGDVLGRGRRRGNVLGWLRLGFGLGGGVLLEFVVAHHAACIDTILLPAMLFAQELPRLDVPVHRLPLGG